jgi:hypothetical protein
MAVTDPRSIARFERLYAVARDPLARYLARRAAPEAVKDLFAEVMGPGRRGGTGRQGHRARLQRQGDRDRDVYDAAERPVVTETTKP